jgi:hypothetical protein
VAKAIHKGASGEYQRIMQKHELMFNVTYMKRLNERSNVSDNGVSPTLRDESRCLQTCFDTQKHHAEPVTPAREDLHEHCPQAEKPRGRKTHSSQGFFT